MTKRKLSSLKSQYNYAQMKEYLEDTGKLVLFYDEPIHEFEEYLKGTSVKWKKHEMEFGVIIELEGWEQ